MPSILQRPIALGPHAETRTESLSELYHENTKLHLALAPQMVTVKQYSALELNAMSHAYKRYRLQPRIALPSPRQLPASDKTFDEVIAARRSIRDFADAELSLEDLSKILHQSYGITTEARRADGSPQYFRGTPSAGALYPLEIYLGIRHVTGIEPGIYHYNVPEHALELLTPGVQDDQLYEACCRQEYSRQAAVVVLIAGLMQRTKSKYGERGYRYVLLDAGHMTQNMYLACTALELAVMTTCGFFDDVANHLLRLDGVDETVLYVALIGKSESGGKPDGTHAVEFEGSMYGTAKAPE